MTLPRAIPYAERRRAAYTAAAGASLLALEVRKRGVATAPGLRETFDFLRGELVRFEREESDLSRWQRKEARQ
jgi:hypothetical protein